MTNLEPQTKTLWETWDAEHVWHPYTQMKLLPKAIGVERGEGSYLYLADGRKVFDSISSWWLTLHGHTHPRIAAAIAKQAIELEHVIFAGFTHEPAATLAHKLVERAPKEMTKVFFSDDGSTAVEVALKMAIQYWKHQGEDRRTFLALDPAYHGDTFGAMSVSARSPFTDAFIPFLFDVKRLPFPAPSTGEDLSNAEEEFLDALQMECRNNSTIAAFIYEPLLLGAAGMKTWRPEILDKALSIVRDYGILTIADEVLTGFGRTGTFFASERVSVSPDMMTLSKGLTGGFLPMGITLTSQHIFDTFLTDDRSKTFFHGHSYTGNPLACAAGVASLEIFEEEPVMERIASIERVHRERLPELAKRNNYKYRILGTMAAMEPEVSVGYLSPKMLSLPPRALEEGLFIRPHGDIIYLLPPYSSTEDDLHRAYDIIERIIV